MHVITHLLCCPLSPSSDREVEPFELTRSRPCNPRSTATTSGVADSGSFSLCAFLSPLHPKSRRAPVSCPCASRPTGDTRHLHEGFPFCQRLLSAPRASSEFSTSARPLHHPPAPGVVIRSSAPKVTQEEASRPLEFSSSCRTHRHVLLSHVELSITGAVHSMPS